jgi:23S rRNA (guanosine2251-2'-O)-methyltransferase
MKKLSLEELQRLDISSFKESQKRPVALVLDNIRSMHNIGSIFRTADAFAIEKIILCGITAQPPHREIEKTALGATDSVSWEYAANTLEAIKSLQDEGYKAFAIEQTEGSISLPTFKKEESTRYALVLGNEVDGVQQEVINACTGSIEIPQFGTKHSFNVSVTAGIVLYHFCL